MIKILPQTLGIGEKTGERVVGERKTFRKENFSRSNRERNFHVNYLSHHSSKIFNLRPNYPLSDYDGGHQKRFDRFQDKGNKHAQASKYFERL